jgi:hypothetical protein
MKSFTKAIFICLFLSFEIQAQNLIPNPGFEVISDCPMEPSLLHYAAPWDGMHIFNGHPDLPGLIEKFNTHGSSDLLNVCSFKMQPPFLNHYSEGCAGFFCFWVNYGSNNDDDSRELARVRLSSALVKDKKYLLWFYVRPDKTNKVFIDAFDVHFSALPIPIVHNDLRIFSPYVSNPKGRILDSIDHWVKIKGDFIAKGGEQYMLVGNLTSKDLVNYKYISTQKYDEYSYYFIDDFHLYQCDRLIDLGADDTAFCGGKIEIGHKIPGARYLWENGDTVATRSIGDAGQYWVEVRLEGCVSRDTVQISVSDRPLVYSLGPDRDLCEGDRIWLRSGLSSPIRWSTGSTLDSILISRPGRYWVEGYKKGCLVRDTIPVSYTHLTLPTKA